MAAATELGSAWFTLVSPQQELCMIDRRRAADVSTVIRDAAAKGTNLLEIPDIGPVGQTCLVGYTNGTLTVHQCIDRLNAAADDELGMFASACCEIGFQACAKAALVEMTRRGPLRAFIASDTCKKLEIGAPVPSPGSLDEALDER